MKNKYLLLSFFLIALFIVLNTENVNSKKSNPPAGNSGDPTSPNTCLGSGCHNGPVSQASLNTLALLIGAGVTPTDTLNLPSPTFKYAGNTLYNITFKISAFTGNYGFQIVALDGSNAQAGTMQVTSSTNEQINVGAGRQYMGHKSANTTKTWTFKWTSPAVSTGPVTFYYCYNTGNNDDNPTGDVIYQGSSTIQALVSGVEDISTKISALNIFPNPVSNEMGLSFDLKQTEKVTAQLFSLDGKLSKELMNEKMNEGFCSKNFNAEELPAGIYLLQLNVGNASITKKIVKQ